MSLNVKRLAISAATVAFFAFWVWFSVAIGLTGVERMAVRSTGLVYSPGTTVLILLAFILESLMAALAGAAAVYVCRFAGRLALRWWHWVS